MKQRLSPTIIIITAVVAITAMPEALAQAPEAKAPPVVSSAVNEDVMYARLGQFFKLITRTDVGAEIEVPAGDFVRDVLEMKHRFDDHVAYDCVGTEHG